MEATYSWRFLPPYRSYGSITRCWFTQKSLAVRLISTAISCTIQIIQKDHENLPGPNLIAHSPTKKTGISSAETCVFTRLTACGCSRDQHELSKLKAATPKSPSCPGRAEARPSVRGRCSDLST